VTERPSWPAIQHLSFPVRDPRASAAFYRDLLSFRELHVSDHIAELAVGETKLVLLRGDATAPKDLHFGFRVDSTALVDEWGSCATAAGAHIDSGPVRQPWGGYALYLRDPDGYLIEIWSDH
jgi:catechol 2,3-dioxygenase-like lactoylglutathione lyase family enzyme